jgi:hypothetical protein
LLIAGVIGSAAIIKVLGLIASIPSLPKFEITEI